MNDVVRLTIRAFRDTFLEPVGSVLEKMVTDGRVKIEKGADLKAAIVNLTPLAFKEAKDQPERDLATALGGAFGAYLDAKAAAAKALADAEAAFEATPTRIAEVAAQKRAADLTELAAKTLKAAEDASKVAQTDTQKKAAADLHLQAAAQDADAQKARDDAKLASAKVTGRPS